MEVHTLLVCTVAAQIFSIAQSIRFATFNIQSGSNIVHEYNLTATAQIISQLNIDVIGLQEVDNFTTRHPIDQTNYIALFDADRPYDYFHFEKMRNFENGGYGISILSRNQKISRTSIFHYNSTKSDECVNPRDGDFCQGIILTEILLKYKKTDELRIYFGTTHLGIGLNGSQQLDEARQLVRWITNQIAVNDSRPYLLLMTGDFNSVATDDTIQSVMLAAFDDLWTNSKLCKKTIDPNNTNGFTFDSLNPSKRIDYGFFKMSENFNVSFQLNCHVQVFSTLVSDHRPLIFDIDVYKR